MVPEPATRRPPVIVEMEEVAYPKAVERNGKNPDIRLKGKPDILEVALGSEARSRVASRVVDEIREKLKSMSCGPEVQDQDCSVCFAVCGRKVTDHPASNLCPQSLCSGKDVVWGAFKDSLRFEDGFLCFGCLLPMVSPSTHPWCRRVDFPPSHQKPSIPALCGTLTTDALTNISSVPPFTHSGSKHWWSFGTMSGRRSMSTGRTCGSMCLGAPPVTKRTICQTISSSSGPL